MVTRQWYETTIVRSVISICLIATFFLVNTSAANDRLIERVAERYASFERYYVRGIFSFSARLGEMTQDVGAQFIQAGSLPGKVRLEIQDDVLGSIVVSDGEATWTYFKALGQYKKEATVPLKEQAPEAKTPKPTPAADRTFLDLYRWVLAEGVTSRQVGVEGIRLDDRTVECTVIELTRVAPDSTGLLMGPDTMWVDPVRAVVLKSVHHTTGELQSMKSTTRMELTFQEIRLDEAPPEELFTFDPPAGAKKVEDFTFGSASRPDLTGTVAPDFRLSDLAGKPHRLENYRGKVVLLDFWASWCGPCRKELPAIEKLHRNYRGKGLVVLAVNSESPKAARSFVEKYGYTFTVLTDVKGSVFKDYAVSSIPVAIVVDREGRVAAHIIGFQGEEALLASIRKAGVE